MTGVPTLTTTATTSSVQGTYPITVGKGSLSATNYAFTNLVNGVLTVGLQPINDFTGAGHSDPVLFRRTNATTAQWFVQGATAINGRAFGAGSLDIPVTGDFDGSGKASLAVYRPSTGQWYVEESSTNYTGQLLATFGGPKDIPVPANYTGSGTSTLAVYRPATGHWFFYGQSQPIQFPNFATGDIPVPGNYDNTGKDEPAIYNPANGQWTIDGPTGMRTVTFGGPGDIPVPGSYDALTTGKVTTELAVWRPSTGQFFIDGPTGGRALQFKVGDIPVPGDYDGIGETEAAVYRPSTGQWLVMGPSDTTPRVFATYGGANDTPTAAPYVFRALKSGGGVISQFSVSAPVSVDLGATARSISGTSSIVSTQARRVATSETLGRVTPPRGLTAVTVTTRRKEFRVLLSASARVRNERADAWNRGVIHTGNGEGEESTIAGAVRRPHPERHRKLWAARHGVFEFLVRRTERQMGLEDRAAASQEDQHIRPRCFIVDSPSECDERRCNRSRSRVNVAAKSVPERGVARMVGVGDPFEGVDEVMQFHGG